MSGLRLWRSWSSGSLGSLAVSSCTCTGDRLASSSQGSSSPGSTYRINFIDLRGRPPSCSDGTRSSSLNPFAVATFTAPSTQILYSFSCRGLSEAYTSSSVLVGRSSSTSSLVRLSRKGRRISCMVPTI
uniref:Putative secreted protein n=1 Tax=Ixodes ricinus TaxID=34613 RepID=A0A6B0URB6_IXORI